jgi:hypothetical protein
MNHPEITMLWRYTTTERCEEILNSNSIYFPKAIRFNDPFDCAIEYDSTMQPEEYVEAVFRRSRKAGDNWASIKKLLDADLQPDGSLTDKKKQVIAETAAEFKTSNANLGVLSLTEDPLSILMWSHYGASHRGVCIGFSREIGTTLAMDDVTHRVEYSDIYPEARLADMMAGSSLLSRKVLLTKARQWAYEREWRLMANKGDEQKALPAPIVRVLLGCEILDDARKKLVQQARLKKIQIFQVKKVPLRFELDMVLI